MRRPLSRIDALWLGLLAATALAWWLGESGHAAGPLAALLVWALAAAKGAGIALEFMALRGAPPFWRRLVLGWLGAVVALLVGIRWAWG